MSNVTIACLCAFFAALGLLVGFVIGSAVRSKEDYDAGFADGRANKYCF